VLRLIKKEGEERRINQQKKGMWEENKNNKTKGRKEKKERKKN